MTKTPCTPPEIAARIKANAIYSGKTMKNIYETLHIGRNLITEMNGGRYPRIDTLLKIADFLGCTVNDLVYKD